MFCEKYYKKLLNYAKKDQIWADPNCPYRRSLCMAEAHITEAHMAHSWFSNGGLEPLFHKGEFARHCPETKLLIGHPP